MPTRSGVHLHARTDVRRPRDVVGLDAFVVHAVVGIREVEPSRRGREGARGLVLAAGGRGTDPARHDALLGAIGGIFDWPAGAQIDAFRPIREHEFRRREDFARLAVDRVREAVAVGMHEHFALPAIHRDVGEDHLVHTVVIPGVVRRHLICPPRFAVVRIAREYRNRPFVVARPHIGIPHAGIRGAVVDEIQLGIVRNPTPDRATAQLPLITRPCFDAEVGAAMIGIERLEAGPDQHVRIGASRIGAPQLAPGAGVQHQYPTAHAELGAAVADDHFVVHDDRRHRDRLADVYVADLHLPNLFAGLGVDGDGVRVERVVVDAPIGIRRAAVHDVAARDADRAIAGIRLVDPLQHPAGARQVERVQDVGPGRHNVHGVVHDERIAFVALQYAGGERRHDFQLRGIGRGDLGERGVARPCVVAARLRPLFSCGSDDRPGGVVINARGERRSLGRGSSV